jgi:hypothetical protein
MDNPSVCDCGYRPRKSDCHEMVVESHLDSGVDEVVVLHVICYKCGKEWVE